MAKQASTPKRFRAFVGKTKLAGGVSPVSRAGTVKRYELYARESMAEVEGKMNDLVALLQGSTPDIMLECLLPIFEQSQVWCPIRTGLMRSTGDLRVDEVSEGSVRAVISYGGEGAAWYAPIVHERIDLSHRPPTRAKWLQQAVEEGYEDLRSRILAAYSQILNLEGGGGGGGGGGKPRLRKTAVAVPVTPKPHLRETAVAVPVPPKPRLKYRSRGGS